MQWESVFFLWNMFGQLPADVHRRLRRNGLPLLAAKAVGLERSHLYKKAEQLAIDLREMRREQGATRLISARDGVALYESVWSISGVPPGRVCGCTFSRR